MNENKDIERRLDDTQPTLEEIAVRECGCPCGADNSGGDGDTSRKSPCGEH